MSAAAANPGEPAFEEPVTVSFGKFTFTRKGWDVTIEAEGRKAELPAHIFLRTLYRALSHDLSLGLMIFYGGFAVHNLGDRLKGTQVKLFFVGEPRVEEIFDREETRKRLTEIYETLQWESYHEWY